MSENVIFCYSGTGNCLDIAKNIARELGDTDIVMMRSLPAITDVRHAKRVGFVFPCYAGGLPGDVERYVSMLTIGKDTYTFGVCSYAAYPGVGLSKLNKIVPLDFWAGISHQCSCIWLFPHNMMMPPLSPRKAQQRSEKLARDIGEHVYYRIIKDKAPPANILNQVESMAWPMMSKKKAELLSASDECIACGQCAKLCPRGNISLESGKATFGSDCIGCLSCLQYCPKKAINMGSVTEKRQRYHNPKVRADELCQQIIHID